MKNFKKLLQIIVFISLFVGTTIPVHAAFPGSNGKLVYTDITLENGSPSGIPFNSIAIDGSNKTALIDNVLTTSLAAGSGRFSADGKKIVFHQTNTDTGESNIYVMNQDGSNQQNLTNLDTAAFPAREGYSAMYGSFHPDGSTIVYTEAWVENSVGGGDSFCHIHAMSVDGSNKQQLTNDPTLCDIYPVYSPDGTKIAFVRNDKTAGTTGIYVMNANGSGITLVKQLAADNISISNYATGPLGTSGSTVDWSPDGSKLVYATFRTDSNNIQTSSINVTDLQGNDTAVLTLSAQQFDSINTAGNYSNEALLNPQFTPEGQIIFRKIAISLDRSFDSNSNQWVSSNEAGVARIQLINADGSNLRTVTTGATLNGSDSNFVLFSLGLPSVQPLITQNTSLATLASTGESSLTMGISALMAVVLGLGFGLFHKLRLS